MDVTWIVAVVPGLENLILLITGVLCIVSNFPASHDGSLVLDPCVERSILSLGILVPVFMFILL